MSRSTHYVPRIGRHLVCALFHEASHRRQPMTKLVDELLTGALQGTHGWRIAQQQQAGRMQGILQAQPRGDPHASSC